MTRLVAAAACAALLAGTAAAQAQVYVDSHGTYGSYGTGVSTAGGADSDAGAAEATRALNLLEAQGFTQFDDFHRVGSRFEASVVRNGARERVSVDPVTGQISRAS